MQDNLFLHHFSVALHNGSAELQQLADRYHKIERHSVRLTLSQLHTQPSKDESSNETPMQTTIPLSTDVPATVYFLSSPFFATLSLSFLLGWECYNFLAEKLFFHGRFGRFTVNLRHEIGKYLRILKLESRSFNHRCIDCEGMFEKNLNELIKGIRAHKGSESKYIDSAISDCRKEIKSKDADTKAQAILKLAYVRFSTHCCWV
jgi:hypothetical protein